MNQELFNGQALAFGAMMISIVGTVVGIILGARRKPAIESEFATKAELGVIKAELATQVSQMKGELSGEAHAFRSEVMSSIRRLHERIETHSESNAIRDERRTKDLYEEIKKLSVSIARMEAQTSGL